jgi:hypothetical protein
LACVFLFFAAPSLHAQTSPEVTKGVLWLTTQVQPDGSLLGEPQSIATPLQARTDAAQTLKLLASVPVSLTNAIAADSEDNTEYLARKIIALSASGLDVTNYVNTLLSRQNPDGGFGGATDYSSNIIDTAWTVMALDQTNLVNGNANNLARAYIVSQLSTDHGMPGANDVNRIYSSALALLALEKTPTSNAVAIQGLTGWLLQRQGADGSWNGNTYLTALVFNAVVPVTADATVRTAARTYLVSGQASDGSWNGDPFLTALVLRALSGQPPASTTTTITNTAQLQGLVVDQVTNLPLAGVTVTVTAAGSSDAVATTDSTGQFMLSNLPAGTFQVIYARSGYVTTYTSYMLTSQQTLNAGIVRLTQNSVAGGVIRGQIRAAATGLPLAGVTVTVSASGAANLVTTSDGTGSFELDGVTPGVVTFSAALAGYQIASSVGTVTAGQTLFFVSSLYADGSTPPSTTHLTGKIISALQSTPLANVSIQASGSNGNSTGVSDANGRFDVTMSANTNVVTYVLGGYKTLSQTYNITAGSTFDVGTVSLMPNLYIVKGRVVDATNTAIAGAQVQVVGTNLVATTAADGSYLLILGYIHPQPGITSSNTIRASATGFNSQSAIVQLTDPAAVEQDFTLTPQTAGAMSIVSLTSDQTHYAAYAPVSFAFQAQNGSTQSVSGSASVFIVDAQGNAVDSQQATWIDSGGATQTQFTFAPGATNITVPWNTRAYAPGNYTVVVRIYQGTPDMPASVVGTVDRQASFTIDPTQAISNLTVTPLPRFSNLGANAQIQFNLNIVNRSNVPTSIDVSYQLKTPSGATVYSATTTVPLAPADNVKSIVVDGTSYTFVESGTHPTTVQVSNGPVPANVTGNPIGVAPDIRIDATQQITPPMITPDGDKRIHLNIQLKGVELQ